MIFPAEISVGTLLGLRLQRAEENSLGDLPGAREVNGLVHQTIRRTHEQNHHAEQKEQRDKNFFRAEIFQSLL